MIHEGIVRALRYAYPPNSLSLCGPHHAHRQVNLAHYANTFTSDTGSKELLEQFSTLYPYLVVIAQANNIKDPFDPRVVEGYWLGNSLLSRVPVNSYITLLDDTIHMKKKLTPAKRSHLFDTVAGGGLPIHAFHVTNVYIRTGHIDEVQTVQSMDACIINWGNIISIDNNEVIVQTRPLTAHNGTLVFGPMMKRRLSFEGPDDSLKSVVKIGDIVSYHWGIVCERITLSQRNNLIRYTKQAIVYANAQHS